MIEVDDHCLSWILIIDWAKLSEELKEMLLDHVDGTPLYDEQQRYTIFAVGNVGEKQEEDIEDIFDTQPEILAYDREKNTIMHIDDGEFDTFAENFSELELTVFGPYAETVS